jgi:hypothetical protein
LGPFTIGHRSLLIESAQHLSGVAHSRFKIEMARHSKRHEAVLKAASPTLEQAVRRLIPDTAQANVVWLGVQQYLANRADPDWLAGELGVIA